ncbi:MAG TPA: kelch repeat-containing protein [Bryobacteraceae bacterium]|jgi:hypothetical protein
MLTAKIETTGIVVGEPDPNDNQFSLIVTDLDTSATPPAFYLTGTFGPDEKDLFLNRADAEKCKGGMELPANWRGLWTFRETAGAFELKLSTFDKSLQSGTLTFTFQKVTSKTSAGKAILNFRTDPDPTKTLPLLFVKKIQSQLPGIIAFYSDPPEGTLNLAGQNITLSWLTRGLRDLKLVWVNAGKIADIGANDRDRGSFSLPADSVTRSVSLKGYDGARPVEESIRIEVLKSDWYNRTLRIMPGDPAYPEDADRKSNGLDLQPTEIINADDSCLYGVFQHALSGRAMLFGAANPFARWDLVETRVPDREGRIPEGFDESPGIYWDSHIWLLGGSQIDPNAGRTSNLVWRVDPTSDDPSWENLGPAGWSERMGHAILEFRKEIWMMGGRDQAGNPLNDVWRLDKSSLKWVCVAEHAGWAPRCLIHPAVWNEKIWLYGGVTEPFSSVVFDDLWVSSRSGDEWVRQSLNIINKSGTPISSCLQVFRKKMYLFGSFRTIDRSDSTEMVTPDAWYLDEPSTQTWKSFPIEGLKDEDWGSSTTFSYQLVNFRDTFLIAKALNYDRENDVLKVYVGSVASKGN